MTRVSAILLAAGLSKRMNGPNKLLLPFHSGLVIQQTYEALSQSEVAEIIVVTGRDRKETEHALSLRAGDRFVHNPHYETGMTSSIQHGITSASGNAYMVCLGDMPWLGTQHYNDLLHYFKDMVTYNDGLIMTIRANGKPANPVIFSATYRKAILDHTEPNGCKALVNANRPHVLTYETTETAYLQDIDTPDDYNRLKG